MCKKLFDKYKNCYIFYDTRKKIVLRDKRNPQKFKAINNNQYFVLSLRVDGCILEGKTSADFILCVEKQINEIYIIELKGQDLKHAITQAKTTIQELNLKEYNSSIKVRIIFNKVPKGYDSEEKRLIKILKKINTLPIPANELYDRYKDGQKVEKL